MNSNDEVREGEPQQQQQQEREVTRAAKEASAAKDKEAVLKINNEANASEAWPAFIPLSVEPEAPPPPPLHVQLLPKYEAETLNEMEATVLITRKDVKKLTSSDFLAEAAKRHSLKLSVTSKKRDNKVSMVGRMESRNRFHQELVTYLRCYEGPVKNDQLLGHLIPGKKRRVFQLIFENLWELQTPQKDVHELYNAYQNGGGAKTRILLNMVLFGQFGLRDGRKHLKTLRNQLLEMMKYTSVHEMATREQRLAVKDAYVYIFSPHHHADYQQVISEYEMMSRTNQLRKFHWSDLRLPMFQKDSLQMKFLRVIRKCKYKCFVDNQNSPNKWSRPPARNRNVDHRRQQNRMLNTQDQMSDPYRLQFHDTATRNFHDAQTIRAMANKPSGPCGVVKPHQAAPARNSTRLTGQTNSIDELISECRTLVNNVPPYIRHNALSDMNEIQSIINCNLESNNESLVYRLDLLRAMLRRNQLR